jgi:hypothetical protein
LSTSIRAAFGNWPRYNAKLRDVVVGLNEEQLALRPSVERWPIWATIGHLSCQRVFALCVRAGAPGAATSPFPDSGFNCPGDDDLETVWTAAELAAALDATVAIVEWCLDNWTIDDLEEVMNYEEEPDYHPTRGFVVQRNFAHDISHITELNEVLTTAGLPIVDLWD